MRKWILKHRKIALSVAAGFGVVLVWLAYRYRSIGCFFTSGDLTETCFFTGDNFTDDRIVASAAVILLSLPTLFLLWFFRTHDIKKQIRTAQKNINISNFHKGVELILDADASKKGAGVIMLYELSHKKNLFKENIEAIVQSANLGKVILKKAQLENVTFLVGANLYGANLQGANLAGANLAGANLTEANLYGANLTGINLQGVNLARANLYGANLQGINLQGTNLKRANLQGSNLVKSNLVRLNLVGSNLAGANLQQADLQGADITGANLQKANLQEANLYGAKLQGADLQGADITGANLLEANLERADLLGATYNEETKGIKST